MKTTLLLAILTAVPLTFAVPSRAADGFIAHEWGTFTSVQGADGVQLEWNPLSVSELPKFVYTRAQPGASNSFLYLGGKGIMSSLQRMETPVIYFYSEREQTVDVTVKFPQGIVTEWFPQIDSATRGLSNLISGPRTIRWDQVRVLPRAAHEDLLAQLPLDPSGSHYYAARETEADFLQLNPTAAKGSPAAAEIEKFLFYRGVGGFQAPLKVTQGGQNAESVRLENTGAEELHHLFIYVVRGNEGKFLTVPELSPGANRSLDLNPEKGLAPLSEVRAHIAAELREGLVSEGLFPAEARAMVKTWDDSWFAEQGVRVLYTLPRAWTDRILPLTLNPQPRQLTRVMVGRAEMITANMEWQLMKQIVRYTDTNADVRAQVIADTRKLGLGRFLEPATRRLVSHLPVSELSIASADLIRAAIKPVPETKTVAAKTVAAK